MARPTRCRRICVEPAYDSFRPEGIPTGERIHMTVDEYEAIRLIDLEKRTHEQCAEQMGISRTTVTEIYETARYKLADCVVNGKTLHISGGNYRLCDGMDVFCCGKHCRRPEFSDMQLSIRGKGEGQMRIGVTYENGEIFQHFGHTEQFKLYDVENGEIKQTQIVDTNGQGHGALASFLTNADVDVLICGGIGGGAQMALAEAGITEEDVTAVAVTYGPGLVGALLVGLSAAKAFAWAHGLPLIPVNHMAGHLMAAQSVEPLEFPLLALLVSGGHTELVYVSEAGDYKIVGETRDDAVGEAYDKVGRVMGLTYPAGREIDELAHQGQDIYDFPRAMIKEDNLEFSFSGLKSAFINLHHNAEQKGESLSTEDLCASFQAAVLDILMAKTKKALEKYPVKTLVVAGGVAANKGLRERLATEITDVNVIIPPLRLCGDNAGMIAYASVSEWNKENFASLDLNAKPSLAFDTME